MLEENTIYFIFNHWTIINKKIKWLEIRHYAYVETMLNIKILLYIIFGLLFF